MVNEYYTFQSEWIFLLYNVEIYRGRMWFRSHSFNYAYLCDIFFRFCL